MKFIFLLIALSTSLYSYSDPIALSCQYGYRNASPEIAISGSGECPVGGTNGTTIFAYDCSYNERWNQYNGTMQTVQTKDCASSYTDQLDPPNSQPQGCYNYNEDGSPSTACEMKTCDVYSDGTLEQISVKQNRNCSQIGIGTDTNIGSMCYIGKVCDLTLSDGSGDFSCSLTGGGELHCIDPVTGEIIDPMNPDSGGGDTGGGDTGGGDTGGGDTGGGDTGGGDTGGGDTGGGDTGEYPECPTGNPDNPNTPLTNECTGITTPNEQIGSDKEENEFRCGIGNHWNGSSCVTDESGCGYVDGKYMCMHQEDGCGTFNGVYVCANKEPNCGTYTDLNGVTKEGCFDPSPNISDPDAPRKPVPVIDPETGEQAKDPVTGELIFKDPDPLLEVDMKSTNRKLDELKQSSLNLLNEQKKTNTGLGTANKSLSSILSESKAANTKLDKVNENLEGLTEEVSDSKDSQIIDDLSNSGDSELNTTFDGIESGLGESVSMSAPDSIKSGLETFVPSYSQCVSIPLDFGIYQVNIQCEKIENFKEVFSWFLYALTFYSVFSIALKQTEK